MNMKKIVAISLILLLLAAGCRQANTQAPDTAAAETAAASSG